MDSPLHLYKAEFFKTLGHSVRLAILDALREGPLSVSELQVIIQTEQSILSQHLAKLRAMKFVSSRRKKPPSTTMSMIGKFTSSLIWQKIYTCASCNSRRKCSKS